MSLRTVLQVAAVVAVMSIAPVTVAQQPTAKGIDDATSTFVLGNVQFILLHELAHLLLSDLDIPVLGPEEAAADYLAALILIRGDRNQVVERDKGLVYLAVAADAFIRSWRRADGIGSELPYWGSHALTIQRYYQIACLIYGSDPKRFRQLPARVGLPQERAHNCLGEFSKANRSLQWALDTYGRQPDDPPGGRTRIVYERAPSLISSELARVIREAKLIETTAKRLDAQFALPEEVELVMRRCGQPEAAWVPDKRELVICYEMLDALYLMARELPGPATE
jgi:hypothetical protein